MTTNTQTKWNLDVNHSSLQFKVRHLAVSNVSGTFKMFTGSAVSETDDFDNAKIECVIDASSVFTNNEQRDNDLRSPNFLNTEQFPNLTFTGLLKKKGEAYELSGNITIRNVTKPITMQAELTGTGKGRFNDTRAGFELTGKLNRKDFGLNVNILTETGSLVIGEDIKLHLDVQLIKQA